MKAERLILSLRCLLACLLVSRACFYESRATYPVTKVFACLLACLWTGSEFQTANDFQPHFQLKGVIKHLFQFLKPLFEFEVSLSLIFS